MFPFAQKPLLTAEMLNENTRIYTKRRRLWKITAPDDLLHIEGECGKCWLAKQNLLIFNPAIYTWDGVERRLTYKEISDAYNENVKVIRSCFCLK